MKKEWRGSGVAQMLYDVALNHIKRQPWKASDNPVLVLETSEFQSASIRFYKRQGFHMVKKYEVKIQPVVFSCRLFVFLLLLKPLQN